MPACGGLRRVPNNTASLNQSDPGTSSKASRLAGFPGAPGFCKAAQAATRRDVTRADGTCSIILRGHSQGMLAQLLSLHLVLPVAWAYRLPIAGILLRSWPTGSVAVLPQKGAASPGPLRALNYRSAWAVAVPRNGVAARLNGAQSRQRARSIGQEQWHGSFRFILARSLSRRQRTRRFRLRRDSYTSGPLSRDFCQHFYMERPVLRLQAGFL